jgi:hypothetical protein
MEIDVHINLAQVVEKEEVRVRPKDQVKWGKSKICPVHFKEPVQIQAGSEVIINFQLMLIDDVSDGEEGEYGYLFKGHKGNDSYYCDEVNSEELQGHYNEQDQPEDVFKFQPINPELGHDYISGNMSLYQG